MAFTTIRGAGFVDFIGTPGVDVGVFFNETGKVRAFALGDSDAITVFNSDGIQRTTTLNGGDGTDSINVVPSLSESSVNGNLGRDTIQTGLVVANSFIGGGGGADRITGGAEYLSSLVDGGAGADFMSAPVTLALSSFNGNDGNDTIQLINAGILPGTVQKFASSSINANAGNDVITAIGLNVSLSGINFIGSGSGDDTINFSGATTDNFAPGTSSGFELTAGSGNDSVTGSTEDDILNGGADNDTLIGAIGEDTIRAGAGNDQITVQGDDDITGGGNADQYFSAGAASDDVTFRILEVSNSAAATTGTVRTFDSFAGYLFNFATDDKLNITTVTDQLAGGLYTGASKTAAPTIDLGVFLLPFADFSALKTELDADPLAAQSTTTSINNYIFTADIGGVGPADYLWIQDSQKAYTSSDLLFQVGNINQITGADIVVA